MSGFRHLSASEIEASKASYPQLAVAWTRRDTVRWAAAALALGALTWIAVRLGLTPDRLIGGLGKLGGAVADMLPPIAAGHFWQIVRATGETLGMAFVGTTIASLVAFPLGFLGAKTVVSNGPVHFLVRRVFDVFRAVPALIWALIFVRAVGLGPMAGVMALAAGDIAPLAKLNAEAIENADRRPLEGVTATGASRLLVLRYGLMPQVLPIQLSQALYFFESNVRSAAILGIVGAGGIGQELSEDIRLFAWQEVSFILILFILLVALIDQGSKLIRQAVIGRRT